LISLEIVAKVVNYCPYLTHIGKDPDLCWSCIKLESSWLIQTVDIGHT